MNSLYQITNNALEYTFNKEEFTEEEQHLIEQEIDKQLQQKSTGIIAVIRDKELLVEAIDIEISRLKELKDRVKKGTDTLKDMTKTQMERLGMTKIDTALGTVSIRKNPISVEVLNEEKVSKAFKKEKVVITVDKIAIKKHFEDTGEVPEGTKINYNKTSLGIR